NNSLTDLGTFTDAQGLSSHGPRLAIKFDTFNDNPFPSVQGEYSDNSTELFLSDHYSNFTDNTEIDIPKSSIDLHSGHVFQATIRYDPPSGPTPGQVTETITDQQTSTSWSHVYSGVDLRSQFQLVNVTGQYAYAGFTASTGGPDNDGQNYSYTYGKGRST